MLPMMASLVKGRVVRFSTYNVLCMDRALSRTSLPIVGADVCASQ